MQERIIHLFIPDPEGGMLACLAVGKVTAHTQIDYVNCKDCRAETIDDAIIAYHLHSGVTA